MADGFWTDAGEKLLPEVTRLRRAIQCEPELGLHLPKTTAKAKAALEGLPLEIREGNSTSGFVAPRARNSLRALW